MPAQTRLPRNCECISPPMRGQILLRHLRVCDDAQKPFASLIYHVCTTHLLAALLGHAIRTQPRSLYSYMQTFYTCAITCPFITPNAFRFQVVWKATCTCSGREITRLLLALSAVCILQLQPSDFQKAYKQIYRLERGANLQVLAFIAQELQSADNMQKQMRVYRDYFHSQLKGPILNCIKDGLKTAKHRLVLRRLTATLNQN